MRETLAIAVVKAFELFGGARVADELMRGQHDGGHAFFQQHLCRTTAQHIDNHSTRHGRSRPGAPFQAFQFDYGVACRTAVVNHYIRHINQLVSR